ncbi:MAG: DMT family transporter [Rhodospirillales bacterium]|nr:DMT family transporter [Rhodospirillales bacterium]
MAPPRTSAPRLPDNVRGILWMVLAMLAGTGMEATGKVLVLDYPMIQVVWARLAFHSACLAPLIGPRLPSLFVTKRLGLHLLRSSTQVVSLGFFFTAVGFIPLADASAIHLLSPLFVVALAAPWLGERAGVRTWIGVIAGFLGALIIIRPGTGTMHWAALLPVCSALSTSVLHITTRKLSQTEGTLTILVYTSLVGVVVYSLAVPFVWVTPDLAGWALMILMGCLGFWANFAQIKAFQWASASTASPFIYTGLVWATGYGFVLFGDLPDRWTVLGMMTIAASGIYILRQERRKT